MNARDRGPEDAAEQRASMIGLGLAVERLRLDAELTRRAVAKRGGLTGNTISHIEKALKKEVQWETVRCLAKGLHVEVRDLVELSLELAPGPAGHRIRQREREADDINLEALIAETKDEEGQQS